MSWIVLVIAGLLEVVWAIGLKYTHGFTRLTPSVITVSSCFHGRCEPYRSAQLTLSGRELAR